MKGEEWGEDKEMLEKKKAAAARMAMLKERADRRKAGLKVNAAPLMPRLELPLRIDKAEKATKPQNEKKQKKAKQKGKKNKQQKNNKQA